jgi:plasmid maintenance system antidote protein VapI
MNPVYFKYFENASLQIASLAKNLNVCQSEILMANSQKVPATALRIRQLREAEGFPSATAFAAKLGITTSRLSNIENGSPLSHDVAMKIVTKIHGVSLDWLHRGKEEALPLILRQRLAAVKTSEMTTSAGSGRGS